MTFNANPLDQIVIKTLDIDPKIYSDDLTYNSIAEWDSVSHMALVAAIEDQFSIMLDTNDILDMSSVAKIKEILRKYDLNV